MFDKTALSRRMRRGKRRCVKRRARLFADPRNAQQTQGARRSRQRNHFPRGRGRAGQRLPWLTEKAHTWAAGTSRCLFCGFPVRTDGISTDGVSGLRGNLPPAREKGEVWLTAMNGRPFPARLATSQGSGG